MARAISRMQKRGTPERRTTSTRFGKRQGPWVMNAEMSWWATFTEPNLNSPDEADYFHEHAALWPIPFDREKRKTGRNEACPCGSGKKYKKCCGANLLHWRTFTRVFAPRCAPHGDPRSLRPLAAAPEATISIGLIDPRKHATILTTRSALETPHVRSHRPEFTPEIPPRGFVF